MGSAPRSRRGSRWHHTFRTRLSAASVRQEIAKKLGDWTTDTSELYNHDYVSLKEAVERLG